MENKTIAQYCEEAHKNAVEKGFYECEVNIGEKLMLIVSELGEALEAHRKNKFANWNGNPGLNNFENYLAGGVRMYCWLKDFELLIKDTFEDEIADTFIRLFDLCGYLDIDIEKFIQAKMAYNKTREHKHGKEY